MGTVLVFFANRAGMEDLSGDGEGGGHRCQRQQGEEWEVGWRVVLGAGLLL